MRRGWTICEAQFLLDNYGRMPRGDIAQVLNRSTISVKDMAYYMGIQHRKAPCWTAKEEEALAELWGTKAVHLIARALNRTEVAIVLKAKKMGLGSSRNAFGRLTANQLVNILGVDVKTVTERWISRYGLKCYYKTTRSRRKFHLIELDDFWKWAEKNQDKFDGRRMEPGVIGKEPARMAEKRKTDYRRPIRRPRKWTPEEDAVLRQMFKQGVTYRKIAERLGRSEKSVGHRLTRITVWDVPRKVGA